MTMDNINSDLIILENLSKQISNLIHENSFDKILELDSFRQSIIKNIQSHYINDVEVKDKVKNFIKENEIMVSISQNKLKDLKVNHNKFNKILKAYSNSK
jgi:hypothetical protein